MLWCPAGGGGDDCLIRFVLAWWLVAFAAAIAPLGRTITAGFVATLIATLRTFAVFTFAFVAAIITITTVTRTPVVALTTTIVAVTASFTVAVSRVFGTFIGVGFSRRRGDCWHTIAAE